MRVQRELFEADVDRFGGAGCGERSDRRAKNCKGHRERQRGRAESTRDPKSARAQERNFPELLDPRCRAQQALVSIVRQACIQGVSNYDRHGHASESVGRDMPRWLSRSP